VVLIIPITLCVAPSGTHLARAQNARQLDAFVTILPMRVAARCVQRLV